MSFRASDPNSAQPCNGEPIVSSEDVDGVVVPKVVPKQVTSPTVRDAEDCQAFCDGFPAKSVSIAEYTPVDGNERGEASCKCAFDFDNDRIVICSNDAERPRSEMSDYCGVQHDYSMCFYPTTSYLQGDEVGEEDEYSKSSASPLVVVGSVLSLVAIVVVAVVVY